MIWSKKLRVNKAAHYVLTAVFIIYQYSKQHMASVHLNFKHVCVKMYYCSAKLLTVRKHSVHYTTIVYLKNKAHYTAILLEINQTTRHETTTLFELISLLFEKLHCMNVIETFCWRGVLIRPLHAKHHNVWIKIALIKSKSSLKHSRECLNLNF